MRRLALALLLVVLTVPACARGRCIPRCAEVVRPNAIPNPMPLPGEGRTQVLVEMTCARVDVGVLPNLLGIPPGDGKTLVAAETEVGAKALLDRWRANPAVESLQAPSILTMAGDEATVEVGEIMGPLTYPESRPAPDRYAPDPRFVGTSIRVFVTAQPSGSLEIEFHGAWKRLDPALERLRGGTEGFARAVADLPVARADTTFELPDGGYVVIAAPRVEQSDGTFRMYTLLHAVRMGPPEAGRILIETGPRIDDPEDARLPR